MKTADELFEIIKDARVVGPDTKLIIEGDRGFYRGYAIVLINKIELKFKEKDKIQRKSDDARHLGIRRKILKIRTVPGTTIRPRRRTTSGNI